MLVELLDRILLLLKGRAEDGAGFTRIKQHGSIAIYRGQANLSVPTGCNKKGEMAGTKSGRRNVAGVGELSCIKSDE